MIAIVVLAFSGIALTVFSDGRSCEIRNILRISTCSEKINTGTDTVQIFHSGGEAIDLDEIKVVLSVDGTQTEFNVSSDTCVTVWHPDGNVGSKTVSSCLEIA